MKRIFIVVVAMATMVIGAWSCAEIETNIEDGFARKTFDGWVEKYAPNAYAAPFDMTRGGPYKDIYIEYLDRGPNPNLKPIIGYTWLNVNYTGKTFSENIWGDDPTNGDVFVTRDSLVSQLIGTFAYTTHFGNDFLFYDSYSTKLCEGLRQAFEQMIVGDSVRVYIPADKGYALSAMDINIGYAVPNVIYAKVPIMFEMRLKDLTIDPFVWERDSVERYAKQEWDDDYVQDTLGLFRHMEKRNPNGYPITADSTVFVYYEEYFMDGFLSSTNIDTVAWKWNVYVSESDAEASLYDPITIVPSTGDMADLHNVFYIVAPHMRQGEIAEVVTVSTWAQGDLGDDESTPEILPYQPMRYRIHIVDKTKTE